MGRGFRNSIQRKKNEHIEGVQGIPFHSKGVFLPIVHIEPGILVGPSRGIGCQKTTEAIKFELVGFRSARNTLAALSFQRLPELLPSTKEVFVNFIARKVALIELGLLWFPPSVFDGFVSPRARLQLSLGFPKGWDFQAAEDLFRSAIQVLKPHWGELNRLTSTQVPTLCGLSGHHYCVPHLGTMNYFGPEYCEYFGGIQRMASAGFATFDPVDDGVVVSLGRELESNEYKTKRAEVEAKLAPIETFNPDGTTEMPRFRR